MIVVKEAARTRVDLNEHELMVRFVSVTENMAVNRAECEKKGFKQKTPSFFGKGFAIVVLFVVSQFFYHTT